MLPIAWERRCAAEVIVALNVVQKAMANGRTLKDAVKVIGQQATTADGGMDWDAAWEQFKRAKVGGAVSEEHGFNRSYGCTWKYLRMAIEEQSPQNASQLLQYATYSTDKDADGNWIPLLQGTSYRRRKVQTVNQFLSFCRDELGFEERWHPSASTQKFIGVTPRAAVTCKKQKNKKDAVPEAALKPLMESFHDSAPGQELATRHRPPGLLWVEAMGAEVSGGGGAVPSSDRGKAKFPQAVRSADCDGYRSRGNTWIESAVAAGVVVWNDKASGAWHPSQSGRQPRQRISAAPTVLEGTEGWSKGEGGGAGWLLIPPSLCLCRRPDRAERSGDLPVHGQQPHDLCAALRH